MDEKTRWPHDAILHAWWVEPGRLLAGEYPGARTAEKAAEKVRLLIDAGVDSIVDLTTPGDHLDPYQEALRAAANKAGRQIEHFAHPIPDMGVIDPEGYDAIVARIRREMDAGRVVYVHCWGGKGRTCTVVGCLLIDGGLDYASAVARIAELRAGTHKAAEACPESSAQHRALRERVLRRLKPPRWDIPRGGRHSVEGATSAWTTAVRACRVPAEPKVKETAIIAGAHAVVAPATQYGRPVGSPKPQRCRGG